MYGPTETTIWSMVHKVEAGNESVPLGHPIANTQIYLLEELSSKQDHPLKPVPVGLPGEIYISGDGLARGYLNRPKLNAESFIDAPFAHQSGVRLYKTGDLARYLADGSIEFLGRIDHQVKTRGFRVELGSIETVLSQHSSVKEAVVVAKQDASENKRLLAYIVPKMQDYHRDLSRLNNPSNTEQIQKWNRVWSATYHDSYKYNAGWNDSFTGLPIPSNDLDESMNFCVERILALNPQRVLDIGCGNGLLLFRIAPHCSHYFGIDISAEAIHQIEYLLENNPADYSHIQVAQGAAHELQGLEPESVDTVIINSVVQYFPSVDYLVYVVKKIIQLLKPGGKIFIGDVRSLPLLKFFHTSIQLSQAIASVSSHELQQRIQRGITHEKELVIDPDLFFALKHHIPQISHVQTLLKRGQSQNELIRFRFDVIMYVKMQLNPEPKILQWDWQQQHLSLSDLWEFLEHHQPKTLQICNVHDQRLWLELKAVKCLNSSDKPETVRELWTVLHQSSQTTSIHPEDFWNISKNLDYKVYITVSKSKNAGLYDVIFVHKSKITNPGDILTLPEPLLDIKSLNTYANNPLQMSENNNLIAELRTFLKTKLPEYMIPSIFVMIEAFPLTPNGKINRHSLPEPKKDRPTLAQVYVPPSTVLEKQIANIWSEVLEVEEIGIYDNFFELGGHSLLIAQLLMQLEEVMKVELPLSHLLKEPTIVGLIKASASIQHLGTALKEENVPVDWDTETILNPIISLEVPFPEFTTEPKHIFLTGATGFLGAFLLSELLKQTSANIYCLVRASSWEEGQHKLYTHLENYIIIGEELRARIIPVLGDLSQPYLGLTDENFCELGRKVDLIYHSGAFVNLVYPYHTLKSVNVLGTEEILKLAIQDKVTPVHFISSLDVFQSSHYLQLPVILENQVLEYPQDLINGYSQSKFVAEKLLLSAQSRGIPVSIYRLGMISGHSQTGVSQINDLMCRIIKGIIQMGTAPDLEQWVNITPVDYAAKAIIYLSKQQASLGKSFHILNHQPLPWKDMVSKINSFGYPIQLLEHEEWQARLLKWDISEDNALNPIKSLFTQKNPQTQKTYLQTFLMTTQVFDCQNTLKGLASTSIICPPVDIQLINTYLSYFVQSGYLNMRI